MDDNISYDKFLEYLYDYYRARPDTPKIIHISTPYRKDNWIKKYFLVEEKMNLTELSKTIRFDNASKGFDPTEGGVDRYLLLAISEICEAQEELRDGRGVDEIYYETHKEDSMGVFYPLDIPKPCGFPVEIADAIIRLLDICGKFDIPVEFNVEHTEKSKLLLEDNKLEHYLLAICGALYQSRRDAGELPNSTKLNNHIREHKIMAALEGLFWICEEFNIDIMKVINEKLEFNCSRPAKHGRKF